MGYSDLTKHKDSSLINDRQDRMSYYLLVDCLFYVLTDCWLRESCVWHLTELEKKDPMA